MSTETHTAVNRSTQSKPVLGQGTEARVPAPSAASPSAIKTDQLVRSLLGQATPENSPTLFTSSGGACPDAAADYSYVLRQFFNNLGIDGPAFQLAGTTTAFNSVQGAVAIAASTERLKNATLIGSTPGKTEARIDIVRGVFQCAGGAAYAAYRPLAICSTMQGVDANSLQSPSLLGRATFMVGSVGNALFGVFYASLGAYFGYTLAKIRDFTNKLYGDGRDASTALTNVDSLKDYIKFLGDKRLNTTASSTLDKIYNQALKQALKNHASDANPQENAEIEAQAAVKAALKKEAFETTKAWIKSINKNELYAKLTETYGGTLGGLGYLFSGAVPSDKECEEIIQKLFAANDTPENRKILCDQLNLAGSKSKLTDFSFEELTGLTILTTKRALKKEAKIAQYTSGSFVATLKESLNSGLVERLQSSDLDVKKAAEVEAKDLIQKLQGDLKFNTRQSWFLFLAGIVGLVATVLGFIFTAGVGAIISGALFFVAAVLMLPADLGYLIASLKSNGSLGKFDKAQVWLNTGVMTASLVTLLVLGFVVGGVFSFGTVPVIVGLVVFALWAINNAATMYAIYKKEERIEKEMPSLESLKKKISKMSPSSPIDSETHKLIKKLSAAERRLIKEYIAGSKVPREGLSYEDSHLNWDHNFGVNFFQRNPMHEDVIKAVKLVESNGAKALLSSMNRLMKIEMKGHYSGNQLAEIRAEFNKLPNSEKQAIAQKIYDRRTLRRSLKEEDKALDRDCNFGEHFLRANPLHDDVINAVEKIAKRLSTERVTALLEKMRLAKDYQSQKGFDQETLAIKLNEITLCFNALSSSEKDVIARKIYNKRAKDPVSRFFKSGTVTNGQLQIVLDKLIEDRQKSYTAQIDAQRKEEHRIYGILSSLSRPAVQAS